MKSIIKEFLTYSYTEKRGIVILFSLILLLQGIRISWSYFNKEMQEFSKEEMQIANEWMLQMEQLKKAEINEKKKAKSRTIPACFPFNPNSIDNKEWMKLGFSEKETGSIIKFRNKGGKFLYKEDLKKLYCIDEDRYKQLENCISLPKKTELIDNKKFTFSDKKFGTKQALRITLLEINGADTLDLITLKGVGKYWAKKIWFFKERLGGIYSEEQLYEIKGMNDTMFYNIQSQIKIDTNLITKIPINSCSTEELQKHPYCWYGIGKAIGNYRSKHGPFQSLSEIQKVYAVKPEIFEKLRHYLVLK
jgi:DNA uptake protein ComE-like DNA-binding protein